MKEPKKKQGVNPTKQHSMKCPKLYGKKCTCDGYHTFEELYEHRIILYIALCKDLAAQKELHIWASTLHSDGTSFGDWFVLGIHKEKGNQITYHLPARFWGEVCEFAEILEKAPDYDNHTSDDVLERIKNLL